MRIYLTPVNWEKYKLKHSRLRTDFFLFTSDLPKALKKTKHLKKKKHKKTNNWKEAFQKKSPYFMLKTRNLCMFLNNS